MLPLCRALFVTILLILNMLSTSLANPQWLVPPVNTSWQWQLQGDINTTYEVDLYDIDLFDTPDAVIRHLLDQQRIVICYFAAGSRESWRGDANQFPPETIGAAVEGWDGEHWIDIRHQSIRNIMRQRLDYAVTRNCDGVEPDLINAYENKNGLDITAEDQLDYNKWLAQEAHARGLSIALKVDYYQVNELVDYFDFKISESCFEYDECELLLPFIKAGKAVLNTEYHQRYIDDPVARAELCAKSKSMGIQTLILPLALDDSFRYTCE